jgi:hypothetical protein
MQKAGQDFRHLFLFCFTCYLAHPVLQAPRDALKVRHGYNDSWIFVNIGIGIEFSYSSDSHILAKRKSDTNPIMRCHHKNPNPESLVTDISNGTLQVQFRSR